jgi:hypothetical protein
LIQVLTFWHINCKIGFSNSAHVWLLWASCINLVPILNYCRKFCFWLNHKNRPKFRNLYVFCETVALPYGPYKELKWQSRSGVADSVIFLTTLSDVIFWWSYTCNSDQTIYVGHEFHYQLQTSSLSWAMMFLQFILAASMGYWIRRQVHHPLYVWLWLWHEGDRGFFWLHFCPAWSSMV